MAIWLAMLGYTAFVVSGCGLLAWMQYHQLESWRDIFTFPRRKRLYLAALAQGASKCECHIGRRMRSWPSRFHLYENCNRCCGAGVVLKLPSSDPDRPLLR